MRGQPSRVLRTRPCRKCKVPAASGSLINGECPKCAGLVPLPLRGEGGQFWKSDDPKGKG